MAHIVSIKGWLDNAKEKGCRYLIIAHDSFAEHDYPIYVKSTEEFWERMRTLHVGGTEEFGSITKDKVHEVYDLEIDLQYQLNENRAWHTPSTTRVN
jgi:hypothetical protein